MRKLASIKIVSIVPHNNADKLEIAKIDGWQCVVGKGEFKTGDRAVYFEIDSILNKEDERFSFMEDKKYRVRTISLRGQISQGLAMPISKFPELKSYTINDDVTEILKVEKYDPPLPVCLGGEHRCYFPGIVPKTDEPRIQLFPNIFDDFKGKEIYISVKCDGTSGSFINIDGDYHVCGRSVSFKENDDNTFWKLSKKYNLKEKMLAYGNYAIQGEVCGPKIQKNRLNLKDHELFVFNVYDIDNKRYFDFDDFMHFCNSLELKTVPIIFRGELPFSTIEEGLLYADGKYEGTDNLREGIVIRATKGFHSNVIGGRSSFKIISNKYLLEGGE